MPKAWSNKDERKYEHIKEGYEKQGKSKDKAEEIAARGALARWLTVFGRVPFFFYLLHIPLIHAIALVVSRIRLGEVSPWLFTNHPMGNPPAPERYTWSLPLLYLVWAVSLVLLCLACRWYADLKARRTDWWLRYL